MRADPRDLARRAKRRLKRLLGPPPPPQPTPTILGLSEIAELPRDELEQACRRLATPVYAGKGVTLSRMLTRYKIYLDSEDRDFGAHLLMDGYWESWVTQFVARTIRPDWIVADIGANHGYYSLLLADLVGPGGQVTAIEPHPGNVRLLERTLALNGFSARTRVCAVAAGECRKEEASLMVPRFSPGQGEVDPIVPRSPDHDVFKVPVDRLDSLLRSDSRIDFLKIDSEGSEDRVIEGMDGIFATQRPAILMEFGAVRYRDPAALVGRLVQLYGKVSQIGFDGHAFPVDPARLLDERIGEERMLFLEGS